MQIDVSIQKDFYKAGHPIMFPDNTTLMYNNLTPRKSRIKGVEYVAFFGLQYFVIEYLIKQWNENFFGKPKEEVIGRYKRMMDFTLGKDSVTTKHLENIYDLGYLPIELKALDEGTIVPIGVPVLTYMSTHPDGFFLPGMLETILSTTIWQPMVTATIAHRYRYFLDKYAMETVGNTDFVKFQGHDFSMRGMSSLETACTSGAAHLLSFVGTDTIPAIQFLEDYYGANIETELVGTSVPASEHSVMCMGTKDDESGTVLRMLKLFPKGILSLVMDTWDLTKVSKPEEDGTLYQLKQEIIDRDGTLVIRPDSTPEGISIADLLTGKINKGIYSLREKEAYYPEFYDKGLLQCLYEIFGGSENSKGYIELDSHIKIIYGDGLGLHNVEEILERIKSTGFATNNVVFGFGSYGYQANTRDTQGVAVKATYGELFHDAGVKYFQEDSKMNGGGGAITGEQLLNCIESREIFKDPITDDGTKKSKKGLLCVIDGKRTENGIEKDGIGVIDQCTWKQENKGLLTTVFKDGVLVKRTTLDEIRGRLAL